MHFILCLGAGLIVLTLGLGVMAFFDTKKEPDNTDGGMVRKMYPADDDPEYSVGEDENIPSWKLIKKVQNN